MTVHNKQQKHGKTALLCGLFWMSAAFPLNRIARQRPTTGHYVFNEHSLFDAGETQPQSPLPVMPSPLFQELAQSQLELLATSMLNAAGESKIKSMALYLPQENSMTGQLEFLPAVLYPPPQKERVFIANDSDSGVAPTLPRTLTKLPGFAHAATLLPGYPMVSAGNEAGVGVVEEVLCDIKMGGTALSVPLFSGSQTVGVLLVSPTTGHGGPTWTDGDSQLVAKAAKSLSLALSMDSDRNALREESRVVRDALSDSLHQVKNPLQALRTYGKLLQRQMVDSQGVSTPRLLELTEHLMVQSDRLVDRLRPVDTIVESMGENRRLLALNPVEAKALVPWKSSFALDVDTNSFDSLGNDSLGSASTRTSKARVDDAAKNGANSGPNDSKLSQALLGDMELEMSFVGDVLDPVLTVFEAMATERGISFTVEQDDDLPGVTIWPKALQEVLTNLLDNAIKYVGAEERNSLFRPAICVQVLPNDESKPPGVTILVQDNGPGIDGGDPDKVFERGYRLIQWVDGSGLGLTIARSLVEEMGGSLCVVPTQERGTTFEVVLYRKRGRA